MGDDRRSAPRADAPGPGPTRAPAGLLAAALACAVVAGRLAGFHYAGSILPYYDQWFVEFENGFMSVARGTSPLATLFLPHNEHLLVTTKLLSFAGYMLNGYWDVRFLVIISALVRAAEAAVLFLLLRPGRSGGPALWGWWLACLVVFAAPLSGYNLLCGMQVSFFLAELSLLLAIALVCRWQGRPRDAVMLVAIQAAGVASFGSAIVIPLATVAVHWVAPRPRPGFWPGWGLSLALSVAWAGFGVGSAAAEHAVRLGFFLELLAWPLSSVAWGLLLTVAGIAAVVLAKNRRPDAAAALGVLVFAAANAALLAWGRPPEMLHHRHWDLLALFPLGWLALGLQVASGKYGRHFRLLLGAVALLYGVFFTTLLRTTSWPYVERAHATRTDAEARMRRLLLSERLGPEAARLIPLLQRKDYLFFDHPFERFMLNPAIVHNYRLSPATALAVLSPEIVPLRPVSAFAGIMSRIIAWGGWLALPAALLAALALVRSWRRHPAEEAA